MKSIKIFLVGCIATLVFFGCKKNGNYPGGIVSPYISLYDLRTNYQGKDVTLTKENMFGSDKIAAIVVSDHRGGNMPAGVLVVQDRRRLNQLRGISIQLGAEAANYVPGDSVVISVEGATLKRMDGILQIAGVATSKINKVATGQAVLPLVVKSNQILDRPSDFESILVSVTKVTFDPAIPAGSTYAGDRLINDGFGVLTLHTEATAAFATRPLPFLANFTGIAFTGTDGKPKLWPRVLADITILSATAPKISPVIITGYLADPIGTDGNYEYIQMMATRDLNFAVTPMSVVTTNNAGTNTPIGFPVEGWATGGLRTYKFNLTTGTVAKGQYFYVGANKNISGAGSTNTSASKWFGKMYTDVDGDGFGTKTTNLLANSGNGAGIAVFETINPVAATIPVDVIFYGGAGSLYTVGPPERGYRITNTDYYDEKNPTTLADQPFFNQGSNTGKFAFPTAANFASLGGTYNRSTGRWTSARMQTSLPMTLTSAVTEIEGRTTLEE